MYVLYTHTLCYRPSREGERAGKRDRTRDRTRDRGGELEEGELVEAAEPQPKKKKEEMDPLLTRTGQTRPLSCYFGVLNPTLSQDSNSL